MRKLTIISVLSLIGLFALIGAGCSGVPVGSSDSGAGGATINIQGTGATFPRPIYQKWMSEYGKIHPNVRLDYQSVGSGAGQRAILDRTADFGASDDPMKDEDLAKAGSELLHIPTVLGAVVLTYNLEEVKEQLKFTPEIVADIYLDKITKWNDPKIAAENEGVQLPDNNITPVYRSDSSGTTGVFTDYLAKTVPEFSERITYSKQPNWIQGVGIGGKGNEGVMGQVQKTPNTIGYVEVAYAKENDLPIALIKNKSGNFVEPSIENISAAAAGAEMPPDMRISITNADGANAYPISSFTYVLLYKEQQHESKGKALVDFLWWAVHDGSGYASDLHYAPLPDEVVKMVEEKLSSITSNGKALRE
ncbi:MAG: phosphate ABC transporter substrate-binding protein PstS [Acidobacteria bacterium]|nr:MAG: phosphate ABC transporter substrate-binding protein PstS [Acidobacteriota bacterium]REJ99301.1 MAG: phosphate ABC transporter substrate-binding protein PstS [Acidobacteriota bacterium]REK15979.1 MAG: phosphate ABC transporter substrate-binding protein PstS [Acidobacteriota bacterium]REK43660.1 MAG: phosphate ABC transporter substrate-binding protein PstS [Acidobacteriota bacterium]